MSYVIDMYKFTREINRHMKNNKELPEVASFNQQYAKKYLNRNMRYVHEIVEMSKNERYDLFYVNGSYYHLTLRGHNIVKGVKFFRPGLILMVIKEINPIIATLISILALIVSAVSLWMSLHYA